MELIKNYNRAVECLINSTEALPLLGVALLNCRVNEMIELRKTTWQDSEFFSIFSNMTKREALKYVLVTDNGDLNEQVKKGNKSAISVANQLANTWYYKFHKNK